MDSIISYIRVEVVLLFPDVVVIDCEDVTIAVGDTDVTVEFSKSEVLKSVEIDIVLG